jgi:peptidoglycan/LPS O-acetylase OafA/YrhL
MWSLSVEEQFYLLWPLLLNRFFRQRYKILAAAIIVAPFFRAISGFLGNHGAEANWFPSAMDFLAIGCLLALFRDRLSQWSQRLDKFIIPIAVATLLMPLFSYPPGVQPLLILTLVGFGIAYCVDNCIRKGYWILNWRPVVWLGTLSYSIYLVQMPFFTPGSPSWLTTFPWNVMCILPAAIACHYLIEKPFLRLRAIRAARRHEVVVQAT